MNNNYNLYEIYSAYAANWYLLGDYAKMREYLAKAEAEKEARINEAKPIVKTILLPISDNKSHKR